MTRRFCFSYFMIDNLYCKVSPFQNSSVMTLGFYCLLQSIKPFFVSLLKFFKDHFVNSFRDFLILKCTQCNMMCKRTIIHIITLDFVFFFEVRDRFSAESTATYCTQLTQQTSLLNRMNFVIIHVKTSKVTVYPLLRLHTAA